MQTSNEQFIQMNQMVRELAHTLAKTEARHERVMRKQRWFLLLVVTLFSVIFYVSKDAGSIAFAQAPAQPGAPAAQLDPQARAAMRETLVAQLPEEQRQKLEDFQRQVTWINQYMQTWDQRMEGAVVSLLLSNMSTSMEAVPKMHKQMEVMNSLMNAMPVVATEMQRMNANISIITANMDVMTRNMDSTMGRMGRSMPPMMPW